MRKLHMAALLLLASLTAAGCQKMAGPDLSAAAEQSVLAEKPAAEGPSVPAKEPAAEGPSVPAKERFATKKPVPEKRLTEAQEYLSLVESCLGSAAFRQLEDRRTEELTDLLSGHYEIIGRTDGAGLTYYLAIRRSDAPVYRDFGSVNVGTVDSGSGEVLQLGYYSDDETVIRPTVLYELADYSLLGWPFGYDSLDGFCFAERNSLRGDRAQTFCRAFDEKGRQELNFLRGKQGLSFCDEEVPRIEFLYQDDETVQFYSSPYPCCLRLTDREVGEVRGLLAGSETEKSDLTQGEVCDYLRAKDRSLRSTGATLWLDGREYTLYGSRRFAGYMTSTPEQSAPGQSASELSVPGQSAPKQDPYLSLEYNEDVYRFVTDKIQTAVNKDYGDFDPDWFKTPLKSASLTFPQPVEREDGALIYEPCSQVIRDPKKLGALSALMEQAIDGVEVLSGCPYVAPLTLTREDGETLCVFIAADSCDSMAYDGRIGFEYGRQADLAAIFDLAMAELP